MSKTPEGRATLRAHGKKPMPVKVATEFQKASKGISTKRLPKRKRKLAAHQSGIEKL